MTENKAPEVVNESLSEREAMVLNQYLQRETNLFQNLIDPRRNIEEECGLPENVDEITITDLKATYDMWGVARRVVDIYPEESWLTTPEIFETDDATQTTKFEKAWIELTEKLSGDPGEGISYSGDEDSNPVFELLNRADRISGIGSFGIIVLGVNDGKSLEEPLEPSDSNELLYLSCYDESMIDISNVELDKQSPRYGWPEFYQINSSVSSESLQTTQTSADIGEKIHYTRVLHLADGRDSSDIFAVPRMRPSWPYIKGLMKIHACHPEMYFQGAFPGISFETHPQLGGDVDIDLSVITPAVKKFVDRLQRYSVTAGMSAKSLAPQVVDPNPQVDSLEEAICISIECPVRIFKGSERGELASSQDQKAWNNRVMKRQNKYISPRILQRFIAKLIHYGILPKPDVAGKVFTRWPDLNQLNSEQQAETMEKRAKGMAQYANSDAASTIMSPEDFLKREMGFNDNEVVRILGNLLGMIEGDENGES